MTMLIFFFFLSLCPLFSNLTVICSEGFFFFIVDLSLLNICSIFLPCETNLKLQYQLLHDSAKNMILGATSSIDPSETIGLESHIWFLVQNISKLSQGLCLDIQATILGAAYNRYF